MLVNENIHPDWLKEVEKVSTFGARVALDSSCGSAFSLADPLKIEGSSSNKSLYPAQSRNIKT